MYHILYFFKPGCSKCAITGMSVRSVASYFHTTFQEINAADEKNDDLTAKYLVLEAPKVVLLQYGKVVFEADGLRSVDSLLQDLSPFFK